MMIPNIQSPFTFCIGLALLPPIIAQAAPCNDLHCPFSQEDGAISYIQTHAASVAKIPTIPHHEVIAKSEKPEKTHAEEHADANSKDSWLYEKHTVQRSGKPFVHPYLSLLSKSDDSTTNQHIAEKALYFSSLFISGTVVAAIYWPLGAAGILKIQGYLLTGCTVALTVKLVFQESFHFQYAKLLTTFHLATSATLGFGILWYRRLIQEKPIHIPTVSEFLYKLLPLGLGFSYSLGCANMALMYCSVAFAAIIGAATPFCSVMLLILLGMPFHLSLLLPISGIVFGCMATVAGTLEFSWYGFMLILLGNLGRSAKAVLQQWIMTGEVKEKYDPVTLLSWQCLICTPILLAWSLATEGTPAIAALFDQTKPFLFIGAVALSCANAAIMNALHIYVIKDLGAIGIQCTAQLKQGLTVLGGVMMFGEKVTPFNLLGGSIVMASAFWYARLDAHLKSQKAGQNSEAGSAEKTESQVQQSSEGSKS